MEERFPHINFEDIKELVYTLPDQFDPVIRQRVEDHNRKIIQSNLKFLNDNYTYIKEALPNADNYQLYMAVYKSRDLADYINPDFFQEIRKITQERVIKKIPDYEDGLRTSDDEADELIASLESNIRNLEYVKRVYKENWGYVSRSDFCEKTFITENILDRVIDGLRFRNHLPFDDIFDDVLPSKEVTGITFIFDDAPIRIGREKKENITYSSCPLSGFPDPITNKEMTKPCMCPVGYVLDYSTWMMFLKNKSHPYTQKKFKKRSLIVLTNENYEENKKKFKNISKV